MNKISVLLLSLCFASVVSAAAPASYEATRETKLSQAHDDIQFMDQATPEELAQILNLSAPSTTETFENISSFNLVVAIDVSIARQSLTIHYPGGSYTTRISSARPGYHTVTGCFRSPRLELMHYSSKYENSPMPHSMFFMGGYAIHGTYEENELGRPASHGCVRVSRADAGYLYGIVKGYGAANTQICVH